MYFLNLSSICMIFILKKILEAGSVKIYKKIKKHI